MRVKCVNDKFKFSTGLFSSELRSGDELTEGNIYEVTVVALVDNFFNQTTINLSNHKFLLYNNRGQWKAYDMERFQPV